MMISSITYVNPVKIFSSDDLPAPDGPIMPVNSPDLKHPDTLFRTIFFSENILKEKKNFVI